MKFKINIPLEKVYLWFLKKSLFYHHKQLMKSWTALTKEQRDNISAKFTIKK